MAVQLVPCGVLLPALLANTPNQAKTLLHSLERAAAGIGLHVNAHKTEFMCFNQKGDISTLDGTSLKLVDKFTYLGSSVSSTKKDIDTRLTKAWSAIDRLSIIWKSNLTDKMKRSFFQAAVVLILLYGCTTWTLTKRLEKKLDGNYTRMLLAILNRIRYNRGCLKKNLNISMEIPLWYYDFKVITYSPSLSKHYWNLPPYGLCNISSAFQIKIFS